MPKKNVNKVDITEDLIINNIENIRENLLTHLDKSNKLEIVLSSTKNIDISGLQLLISLKREVLKLEKEVIFSGIFNDSFSEGLNKIIFNQGIINNGEDLQLLINEAV